MEATIKDLEKMYKKSYNWDKLKTWLEELIKESGLEGIIQVSIFNHVLEKMQELEQGKDENEEN